ncbi:hypothetical protein ACFYKX_11145 [Cytobacillus sp. FJAT-54145]|uniref:Uncharacterized protein n=1 Tax=Cytobacillus spartinae TaxID=3299023 RepID=A0ABW6KD19_9BACI
MQIIQQHSLQDIYRIQDGLLVVVNKYKSLSYYEPQLEKVKKKKLKGISKAYELVEEVTVEKYYPTRQFVTYPANSLILHSKVVEPLTDPQDYYYEIKASGGTIEGNLETILQTQAKIQQLLEEYRRGERA